MSLGVRLARPDDMEAITQLADRVFRSKRSTSMADEFPYLYAGRNAHHWAVAMADGEAVSIVGTMVWPAVIGGAATHVASLGSVATDPAFRGQGLATRLLGLLQETLTQESVRLVLISGDLPLYLRFGARPIGRVRWYALNPQPPADGHRYAVRPLDPHRDANIVARLHQSRGTRFGRSLSELTAMLEAQPITQVEQGTKVALLISRDGEPVSYGIVNHRPFQGRGASRLVEWAGDPAGVLHALRTLPDWPERGMEVPVLTEDRGLATLLEGAELRRSGPVSWLAKVIDGTGLVQDLAPLWSELGDQTLTMGTVEPDYYDLSLGSQHWAVSGADLTEWMFGWEPPHRPPELAAYWPLPALWPEALNYI